eukprot:5179247-Prymnesium_polylepis.1
MRHGTWDMRHETWDMGHGHGSWDMGCGTWTWVARARLPRGVDELVVVDRLLEGSVAEDIDEVLRADHLLLEQPAAT